MGNRFGKIRLTGVRKFLGESLLIVFSVLFALFIDQCQSDAKERERTESILGNIRLELERNLGSTRRLVSYHDAVLEKLGATPTDSLEEIFFSEGRFLIYDNDIAPLGVSQEVFKDIAWNTAEREDISGRISFERAQTLFEVYQQQQNVTNTIAKLVDILSERDTHRKELVTETVAIMRKLFEEMRSQEIQLVSQYERALSDFQ